MLLPRLKGHGKRRGLQFAAVRQAPPSFLGLCFCRNMHWSEWVVVSFLPFLESSSVVVADGFLLRSFFSCSYSCVSSVCCNKIFSIFLSTSELGSRSSKVKQERERGKKKKKFCRSRGGWGMLKIGNC